MSALSDIIIRIRSTFDRKPVDEAAKSVETVGVSGKEAGQSGADGFNAMSTAAAAATGNIQGMVGGLAQALSRVKALGMSMMQLSLVAAVLTSLVKLFQALAERADQTAAGLRAIQAGNVEAAVARITASYAKMREETERAQGSRDKLFDVNMQELESVKNLALAQIELNKQRELGTAKTDAERAAIEAKYKAQAMDRAKVSDDAAAGFQRELLGAKAAESEAQAERDQQEIADLMQQLSRRQQQTSYAQGQASRKAHQGGTWADTLTLGSMSRGREGYQRDADKGRADVAQLIASIEGLQKSIADNTEAAAIYRKQADVAGIDIQTSDVMDQSARTAMATDERMRAERERMRAERERNAAEAARLQSERDALRAELAAKQAEASQASQARQLAQDAPGSVNWAGHESAAVSQLRNQETSILRSLDAFSKAAAARDAAIVQQLENITARQSNTESAVRNLPN